MRNAVAALSVLVLLTGCAREHAPAPAIAASAVAASAVPTSAVPASRPALCDRPRPAEADPFPINRDADRRDSLLHFSGGTEGERYVGDVAHFEDLDAAGLAKLLQAKFIDPYDRQNAAPTAWDIFQFLGGHPGTRAMGYVVSPDRDDYRTSLETVYAEQIDAGLRADAAQFCGEADEVTLQDGLECFWD